MKTGMRCVPTITSTSANCPERSGGITSHSKSAKVQNLWEEERMRTDTRRVKAIAASASSVEHIELFEGVFSFVRLGAGARAVSTPEPTALAASGTAFSTIPPTAICLRNELRPL